MYGTFKRFLWTRLMRFASRLRFPKLLGLVGLVFALDLIFPDAIPFVDEVLLGLATILLGSLRKGRNQDRRERLDL